MQSKSPMQQCRISVRPLVYAFIPIYRSPSTSSLCPRKSTSNQRPDSNLDLTFKKCKPTMSIPVSGVKDYWSSRDKRDYHKSQPTIFLPPHDSIKIRTCSTDYNGHQTKMIDMITSYLFIVYGPRGPVQKELVSSA